MGELFEVPVRPLGTSWGCSEGFGERTAAQGQHRGPFHCGDLLSWAEYSTWGVGGGGRGGKDSLASLGQKHTGT